MSKTTNVYTLKEPISYDGKEITEVTFKRLKAKDMVAVEDEILARAASSGNTLAIGDLSRSYHLAARCTGLPYEAILEMSAGDATAIVQKLNVAGGF